MNAEVLKVICEGYEARIRRFEEEAQRLRGQEMCDAQIKVCLKHGGHEFEKIDEEGYVYERCKFCGKIKE